MIWKFLLGAGMTAIIAASFLYVPAIPGFGATGETARLIIYHVPTAWVAVLAYLMATVYSVGYLLTRDARRDRQAVANAELGTVFCLLATVTGAIWSRAAWGMYWNWDPRQTSIAVLLMIYAAYFVLRSSIGCADRRARLSAVYAILAFTTVPFLVFVVPRVFPSLHPNLGAGSERVSAMSPEVWVVFLASLVCFTVLYLWLQNIQVRLQDLQAKRLLRSVD
ncbi:MAG: cytochrome c biogenesis protein CcsA [Firmicutes bacterium]|nr:cytochrome c biogenesis protein CcsA [Dethiobacter sp.]MBS3889499.1 cytochrome c biogenesis protein CcsA [Bacillota bacterium]MBS4055631.1 cytochrome c biogenesis protein CcsA [Thermaerobacter sp.]